MLWYMIYIIWYIVINSCSVEQSTTKCVDFIADVIEGVTIY